MNKHWKAVALGEVVKLVSRNEKVNPIETYNLLGIRINGNGVFLRETKTGTESSANQLSKVKTGDFIFSRLFAWNGAFDIVKEEFNDCYVSNEFPTFLVDETVIDKRFLLFWFRLKPTLQKVEEKCTGSTPQTRNRFKEKFFFDIKIHLPPLTEQRRIVARIEALAAKVEEAKKLRQEIATDIEHLLAAMAHRNDLSEDEKLKQGWLKLKLGDVLSQVKNAQSVKATESYRGLGIYSFGKGCIKKSPISGSEIKATTLYKVSAGQFIYARLNAYEGSFALVTNEFDGCYVSNEFPTFACNAEYILPEFLMAYFHTPHTWQELRKKITGIGGDSGNRRIRLREKDFLSHQILLPPLSWQHKIKQIHRQQKDIKPLQDTVEKELNALMPAILDKAFKGEL